jgi:serine/threonine protein kinase
VAEATRFARSLASPIGVLISVPVLVVVVGVTILLLGREASRSSVDQLVRQHLADQAARIEADVAVALDQAEPLMARLRELAEAAAPVANGVEVEVEHASSADLLVRLHDLVLGRPGVSYVSISFPDGSYVQADATGDTIETQSSRIAADGTHVAWFGVREGALVPRRTAITDYDPRERPFYALATRTGARAWTPPYTFFRSHETGITCTEPVIHGGALLAVLTVDFDVRKLSSFVARPGLAQARSIVFTGDAVVLAYPAADRLVLPATDRLLVTADLGDPALDALAASGSERAARFLELATDDGGYVASVAPIGGRRAGVEVPLDWYVATVVPVRSLLGPARELERASLMVSLGALAIAVGLALVLAWNLVRMRRQVAASREEARSAHERARELGSYRLVAKLGAGGMGEVWRAEHRMLARSAAIKLIRPEAMQDPVAVAEIRERFRREAQTLASMRSRHTISLYDYGVTEAGVFYYVMELLDGVDLESLVVRFGPQPAARVIAMLAQACASLAEAHDAGLLHRDIKPPNLFVSRAADEVDIVKLLDFGIVQLAGDAAEPARPDDRPVPDTEKLTRLGAMLGTPGFMAPEQILGMELDGRADLYALGCVAWWLLAGREVFERTGAEAKLLHRHVYDPIPSLGAAMRGWCPPRLEELVAACLAKEVDRRPASARELRRELEAIEIPAEHAWTTEHAIAWWAAYEPPEPAPRVASGDALQIAPGKTIPAPQGIASDPAFSPTVRSKR